MSAESVSAGNRRRLGLFIALIGVVAVVVSTAKGLPHELTRQQISFLEAQGKQAAGEVVYGQDNVTQTKKVLTGRVVSTEHEAHIDVNFTTLEGRLIRGSLEIPFESFENFRHKSLAGEALTVTVLYDPSQPESFTTVETSAAQHDSAMWRALLYLGLCNAIAAAAVFGGIALWRSSRVTTAQAWSSPTVIGQKSAPPPAPGTGSATQVRTPGQVELAPWERPRDSEPK